MNETELKHVVEALLMVSPQPVALDKILSVFDEENKPSLEQLKQALHQLEIDYRERAIELKLVAGGYCLRTRKEFSPWITKLFAEKPAKYSRALLETLAVIAYRQPVTRAEIEDIRGVAISSQILKTLLEREWIRIAAYRDVPGKPAVYTTTKIFLDYFNLVSLKDLPKLIIDEKQSSLTE